MANAYSLGNYVMFSTQVCNGACTSADEVIWDELVTGINGVAGFSAPKEGPFHQQEVSRTV